MWSYASNASVAFSTTVARPASIARSSVSVTSAGSRTISPVPVSASTPNDSANFDALRILIARRRPIFICPTSNAASVPRRADAAQYRTASDPCSSSRPMGVTTLPLDFDIFLRSGSRIQPEIAAFFHGSEPNSRCERTTVEKSHVRMMSWPCGRRSMGKTRSNRSGSTSQPPAICGVSDDVAHVSMMSFSPTNPPGTPRWSSVYPAGTSDDGSTGSVSSDGTIGWSWSISPDFEHGVPQRDRDAEEALARDEPVAVEATDPVLVAHAHEVGVERELLAAVQQLLAQVARRAVGRRPVATAVADVPLARRDDLERLVALLEEVRLALGRHGLAVEVARVAQRVDDDLSCGERRLAGELGEHALPRVGRDPVRGVARDPTVARDDRARRELQLAPPLHVGEVAERAAHRDARALVALGGGVGEDGQLDVEQRRAHRGAEQVLVPLVVGVRDERHARGEQLGARRLDVDGRAVVRGARRDAVERDLVEVARVVARLELGLRDGGLERHVPQPGRLGLVRLAAREVAQERALRRGAGPRVDRLVVLRPVDREPEPAPQRLELLLVLGREPLAQLDEVAAAHRHLVGGLDGLALAALVRGSKPST